MLPVRDVSSIISKDYARPFCPRDYSCFREREREKKSIQLVELLANIFFSFSLSSFAIEFDESLSPLGIFQRISIFSFPVFLFFGDIYNLQKNDICDNSLRKLVLKHALSYIIYFHLSQSISRVPLQHRNEFKMNLDRVFISCCFFFTLLLYLPLIISTRCHFFFLSFFLSP